MARKQKKAVVTYSRDELDEFLFYELTDILKKADTTSQVYYGATGAAPSAPPKGWKVPNLTSPKEATVLGVYEMDVPGFIPTPLSLVNLASGGEVVFDEASGKVFIKNGGIPQGRVVEANGGSSDGKTAFLLCLEAAIQEMGGKVAHFDQEKAMHTGMAKKLHVVVDRGWIGIRNPCIEGVFDQADRALIYMAGLPHVPFLLTWDSIAATPIRADLSPDYAKQDNYARSKVVASCIRKFGGALIKGHGTVILINQMVAKIEHNMMKAKYMAEEDRVVGTSGKAKDYAESFQLQFMRKGKIHLKQGQRKIPVGIRGRLILAKSRFGGAYSNFPYTYYYQDVGRFHTGFNDYESVLTYLAEQGRVKCDGKKEGTGFEPGFKNPRITLPDGTIVEDKNLFDLAWYFQQRSNARQWADVLRMTRETMTGSDLGLEAIECEDDGDIPEVKGVDAGVKENSESPPEGAVLE